MELRLLSAVVAAVVGLSGAPAPDGWGQAASHATGDYFNPGESALTPAVVAKVRPRWSVPLRAARCAVPSTPLVGAHRLVTAAGYRITGYDATTGKRKWRTPAAGRRHIGLAAIVGGALVAQYRDCRSGRTYLTALDVRTGATVYTRRTAGMMYNVLVDKGVLVGGLWEPAISGYGLRAYRISDGAQVWARPGSIAGEAVSAGGRIVVRGGGKPGGAIDISTGRPLWPISDGCFVPIGASPDGTRFYLGCGDSNGILAMDAATGAVTATFPSYGPVSGFATDGERIFLNAGGVLAVDAGDGSELWSARFAERGPIMFSAGGGVLYGWRGFGHPAAALDAKTGRALDLTAKSSAIEGPPLVANGHLYGRTGSSITAYAP